MLIAFNLCKASHTHTQGTVKYIESYMLYLTVSRVLAKSVKVWK